MFKRKREKADEESTTPEQPKKVKKQKTNTTRVQATLDVVPKHNEIERSAQASSDKTNAKLAHKSAKKEKKALEKSQRDNLGRNAGIKTGEADDNITSVDIQERLLSDTGQTAASRDRYESREREKEGGQILTETHHPKKEKRKHSTSRPNGKKNKRNAVEKATWRVSDPLGGHMLDADPVFPPDEK